MNEELNKAIQELYKIKDELTKLLVKSANIKKNQTNPHAKREQNWENAKASQCSTHLSRNFNVTPSGRLEE